MPIVRVIPNTDDMQRALAEAAEELHRQLGTIISEIWADLEQADIVVNLYHNTVMALDPNATALEVRVETCPDPAHEASADELRNRLKDALIDLGFTDSGTEVWVMFLPGSWLYVHGGRVVDSVDHATQS